MVELYDGDPAGEHDEHPGVLLYHHWDGYPSSMIPDLTTRLKHAAKYGYWWDSERVGAMLVAWSVGDPDRSDLNPNRSSTYAYAVKRAKEDGKPPPDKKGNMWGVPVYHPALNYHGDLEYLYRVYLHYAGPGAPLSTGTPQFTIVPFAIGEGWWDDAPAVPAPDDRLLKLDVTAKGLLKSCPVCGLKLTTKKLRDEHYCSTRR